MITKMALRTPDSITGSMIELSSLCALDIRRAIGDVDALFRENEQPAPIQSLMVLSILQHACATKVALLPSMDNPIPIARELVKIASFCQLALTLVATGAAFDIAVHGAWAVPR